MYNYCTLFDSNYLTRGLAMYESLKKYSSKFHLYIFAFDERSLKVLEKLNLKFVTVISLKEFEDEELLKVKKDRTVGEYCWTCTPSTIKYCIERYSLKSCTYLDSDLFFFSDPSVLIDEMKDKSILITEHRYTPKYDQSATSGIYCVQFMTFNNDENGMKVLNWWRDACNKWCYARIEDGKFGDQKYLDNWTKQFEGVHILKHLGGGVAPWNMQQYDFSIENDNIQISLKETSIGCELIFFHFHGLKLIDSNLIGLTNYQLFDDCKDLVYQTYLEHLYLMIENIRVKFNFEFYEHRLPKNFYVVYMPDKNAYLHS